MYINVIGIIWVPGGKYRREISKNFWSNILPTLKTSKSSENQEASPLANAIMPNVVMTGLIPILVIINPLIDPKIAPIAKLANTTAHIGNPIE